MVVRNRRYLNLTVLSGFSYVIAFFHQMLLAYYFGTSSSLDGYFYALAILGLMMVYLNPIKEAIVSSVFEKAHNSLEGASEILTSGLVTLFFMGILSCALILVGTNLFDIGHSSEVLKNAINILPLLIPYVFIFALSEMCLIALTSFDLAEIQAKARVLCVVTTLVVTFFIAPIYGVNGIVASITLGQISILIISLIGLHRVGLRIRWNIWGIFKEPKFLLMFFSLLVSYCFSQSYIFLERWALAGVGEGLISSYQYAYTLVTAMVSVIAYPMINLLWPKFMAHDNKRSNFSILKFAFESARPMLILVTLVCFFIFSTSSEAVNILFYRGEFNEYSLERTVIALRSTIFAAIPLTVYTLGVKILMSKNLAYPLAIISILMAIFGSAVITLAVHLDSTELLLLHWLISTAFGALIIIFYLMRNSEFTLMEFFKGLFFVVKVGAISYGALFFVPDLYHGEGLAFRLVALISEGIWYFIMTIFLFWSFGMLPKNLNESLKH